MTGADAPQNPSGGPQPVGDLALEHATMRAMLARMAALQRLLREVGPSPEARRQARTLLDYFDHAALAHHADEERVLFPRLLAQDRLRWAEAVERWQADHRAMRALWPLVQGVLLAVQRGEWSQAAARQTASWERFVALHVNHLVEEDEVEAASLG